jgi:hypothetical protein
MCSSNDVSSSPSCALNSLSHFLGEMGDCADRGSAVLEWRYGTPFRSMCLYTAILDHKRLGF